MCGVCPNKRLMRVLDKGYKGEHRILRELDMVRIVNEIKELKELNKPKNPILAAMLGAKKNPREINIDTDSD